MTVVVSGGFDPLHVGHLNLIKTASVYGSVVVIVDSDEYVSSKHKLGMPQAERVRIVESLKDVVGVIPNWTADGDCSDILSNLRPELFVVGPDKDIEKLPERKVCERVGIGVVCVSALKKEHSSRNYAKPQYDNPPVCCSVIAYREGGEVLVGKRRDNGKWDLPGGFLEPGETLSHCARREFQEEVGCSLISPRVIEYFDSYVTEYEDGRQLVLVVFTTSISVAFFQSSPEMSEFQWVTKVPDDMNNKQDAHALAQFFLSRS